jgi:hypothetical protein
MTPAGAVLTGVVWAGALGLAVPAAGAGGTRTETVPDTTLNNMPAYTVTLPANWHFQGVLLQGAGLGKCPPYPEGVWRATSPDGLSVVESLPTMAWVYGTGPQAAYAPKTGCLPLKQAISAQDFLKYLAATLQMAYIADEPIPGENAKAQQELRDAEAKAAAQWAAMRLTPPRKIVDLAQATVAFKNGTFAMKGRLHVKLDCTETKHAGMKSILRGMPDTPPSVMDDCQANAMVTTAPEDRLAAVLKQWSAPGMGPQTMHDWGDAWVKRAAEQSQQQNNAMLAAAQKRFQAQQQAIRHSMAVQQQMHEQFMQNMQAGTDRSMARAAEVANSNHRMAQDMVDYSLDRQTVMDPGTGQISKVSSAYSSTWVDASGKTSYQANDPNANPNGVLPGNWTRQAVVHGDGTP